MLRKIVWWFVKAAIILVLPFLVLIRGAVVVHTSYNLPAAASILCGIFISTIILYIYLLVMYGKVIKGKKGVSTFKSIGKIAGLLVIAYALYGLLYVSNNNLKQANLRSEIMDLHPILRLATTTLIQIDKSLIITDASRTPEDYHKMGLPRKGSSLHYTQADGYAYAIDLRTNGRSTVQNSLTALYFKLMGLNTLRHTGTDDHLHISLYCRYRPRSI